MPKKASQTAQIETVSHGEIAKRLRYFQERRDQMVQTIHQLVEIESPSDNKDAVDRLGTLLAGRFEGLGGHAKFHRVQKFGDHLQVDFAGTGRENQSCFWDTWIRCIRWAHWRPCRPAWPAGVCGGRVRLT